MCKNRPPPHTHTHPRQNDLLVQRLPEVSGRACKPLRLGEVGEIARNSFEGEEDSFEAGLTTPVTEKTLLGALMKDYVEMVINGDTWQQPEACGAPLVPRRILILMIFQQA